MYPRKQYMDKLIAKKDNGRVKVITGLRRSGKSVLLFDLYHKYLLQDDSFRFVLATTGLRRKFGTEGDVATPFMRLIYW